jgi:hypothetical protein
MIQGYAMEKKIFGVSKWEKKMSSPANFYAVKKLFSK